ncbi:hypothetical protein F5Y15DRAFT_97024 [Xylariaceae sp. FL0016]|nr:hypothetical protein F5Y15DRAFT_97024 [Xylariaceae sp. FL0016]
MSLRIPVHSNDARVSRDQDPTLAGATSYHAARSHQLDSTLPPIDTQQPTPLSNTPPLPVSQRRRRHVVIPDPVAFRYLEEDETVSVVERKQSLRGYELYLVEQWACSRQSPTLVIVTYTGDERHSVVVGVLAVPADANSWSPKLRIYFKAIQQYHARPKDTPLGELMVTNLSSFPSALTVISVPDGDIKQHRRVFIVNEDLKRLGCSGRAGMTLSEPTGPAKAKFYQLYKTDDKIPFADAVVELVKLCQVALCIFGNLDQVYIDGLLCDKTETAIGDWWTEFGVEYFNIEPTDGILGPTTVVALLGLLMGARNRLSYFGAPVLKDVFDIDATERGISYFQKYQKLERTRKLDRQTLHRLQTVTAKAAAGEGWGVQKAVKSTVSEIGGKRGEIVLGMVGGRDKGGIGDIETIDLDKFISLASGERAKWLWHGKPRRAAADHDKSLPDMTSLALFGKEDLGGPVKRAHTAPLEEEKESGRREEALGIHSALDAGSTTSIAGDSPGDRDAMRRGVFKNVARDARSGLGRIKDAMTSGSGLRGHVPRPSKDDSAETPFAHSGILSPMSAGSLASPPPGPGQMNRAFTWKTKPEEYLNGMRKEKETESHVPSTAPSTQGETLSSHHRVTPRQNGPIFRAPNGDSKRTSQVLELKNESTATDSSAAGSTTAETEPRNPVFGAEQRQTPEPSSLRRRHSLTGSLIPRSDPPNEARWPRRLSFGDAEEAVLRWDEVFGILDVEMLSDEASLCEQTRLYELVRSLYMNISDMEKCIEPWVIEKIKSIETMDDHYAHQQDELQSIYNRSTDAYQHAKQDSQEVIAEQRAHITEALKEVEVQAAKLEYEINALVSRVQDVEDGAAQFEIQVNDVERRADELKAYLETESWLHWAVRTLTGIGTGPNITKPRQAPEQRR